MCDITKRFGECNCNKFNWQFYRVKSPLHVFVDGCARMDGAASPCQAKRYFITSSLPAPALSLIGPLFSLIYCSFNHVSSS